MIDEVTIPTAGVIETPTGGTQGTMVIIAQGNTKSTRIGRKSVIKQINWRYNISLPSVIDQVGVSTSDTVRVILYQDKQCNGATATVTDILETADYQSFNQLANKHRFRILMDRTHDINRLTGWSVSATNSTVFSVENSYSFYKKCNITIEYDNTGPTGALTTIRSNNICVLLISKIGNADFDSQFRLRFTDS